MTVRIGITGAAGRMGRMLAEAIAASDTPARLPRRSSDRSRPCGRRHG
ncbi:MAG: hypothetical protein CM15mP25_4060 [Gammaproteobacteria bacterium]|nr:MAG: hypothetical protein CM15mP25_4060 [Gammaproteobacteria bacterium]